MRIFVCFQVKEGLVDANTLIEEIEDIGFDAEHISTIEEKSKSKKNLTGLRTIEINISGMTCAACSGTIERHLQGLPGVQQASRAHDRQ